MELSEFLEKFLPEYTAKYEKAKQEVLRYSTCADVDNIIIVPLIDYFQEALQNFTDIICKKQIEKCYKYAKEFKDAGYLLASDVLFSEQPNIDEL